MGASTAKLSPKVEEKVMEVFRRIDTDGSKLIDKAETLKYWYATPHQEV